MKITIEELNNYRKHREEFKKLLANETLKFISAPWKDSMETKGAMIALSVK